MPTTVLEKVPVNPPGELVLASAEPEAKQGAPPPGTAKKRRCNPGKRTREKLKRIRDARPEATQPASTVSAPQQQQVQPYQHRQQPYVRRGGMGDPPLADIIAKHRDLRPGGACPVDLRTKVHILKRRQLEQEWRKRQADRRAASGRRAEGTLGAQSTSRPASGRVGEGRRFSAPQNQRGNESRASQRQEEEEEKARRAAMASRPRDAPRPAPQASRDTTTASAGSLSSTTSRPVFGAESGAIPKRTGYNNNRSEGSKPSSQVRSTDYRYPSGKGI